MGKGTSKRKKAALEPSAPATAKKTRKKKRRRLKDTPEEVKLTNRYSPALPGEQRQQTLDRRKRNRIKHRDAKRSFSQVRRLSVRPLSGFLAPAEPALLNEALLWRSSLLWQVQRSSLLWAMGPAMGLLLWELPSFGDSRHPHAFLHHSPPHSPCDGGAFAAGPRCTTQSQFDIAFRSGAHFEGAWRTQHVAWTN